jgi:hypothetical protein
MTTTPRIASLITRPGSLRQIGFPSIPKPSREEKFDLSLLPLSNASSAGVDRLSLSDSTELIELKFTIKPNHREADFQFEPV